MFVLSTVIESTEFKEKALAVSRIMCTSHCSRVRVVIFADFKPLRHIYIHVVAGSSVVVHLHRSRVGHMVHEIQFGHQVLLGLEQDGGEGCVIMRNGKSCTNTKKTSMNTRISMV